MKHVVCFGANSDIAKALLRRFVEHEPSKVIMFGRDLISLQDLKRDLLNRGALGVEEYFFDATKPDSIREAFSKVEAVDYLICAHGCLPKKAMFSFADIERVFWINYFSHVLIAELALEIFMKQGFGKLVVFGSVAGDRGRKKVGYYAAAKAALDSSLSALRQEFSSYPNVQILTVKPGFIKTKMTSNLSGPFPSEPEVVAEDVFKAMLKNKNVVYTPWFWRWIMAFMRLIPESVFKRLSF